MAGPTPRDSQKIKSNNRARLTQVIDRALATFNVGQKKSYADGIADLNRRASRMGNGVAGFAALTLTAHPVLQEHPDALLHRLTGTARTGMVNLTGPNDPDNTAPSYAGTPCRTRCSRWRH